MLKEKKAVITGASQGLGKEIAKEFVRQGADICICARDIEKLKEITNELNQYKVLKSQKIIYKKADISIENEIDALYDYAVKEFGSIDCVVNNAAIQGPIGPSDEVAWEELKHVVEIDLMGTLYSMRRAASIFKEQKKGGHIVNLSGGGAVGPRPNFMGYSIAKAAVIRATENMALECRKYDIYINAVAPGAMNTKMLDELLDAGEKAVGKSVYEKAIVQRDTGGSSPANAAKLIAYLASDDSEPITGRLISAVWDNWEHLKEHEKEITDSDVFTLRRIIPEDRGYHWENNK